jgi:predicted Zn-dependent protease
MVGLAAYRTERYAEALAELRTVRRMTGSQTHLPVMADCERGLGRPDRALDLARSHEARLLDPSSRIELLIVEAGARLDLGDPQAAVAVLQIQELSAERVSPTLARLRYAYAEALRAAGRDGDAEVWHRRARQSDPDGSAGLGSGFPADHDSDLDADEQLIDILDLESDPPEDA